AEYQFASRYADVFGAHDLVGTAMLEHAVLVDARFVRERVRANDRLVARNRLAGDLRKQARRCVQALRADGAVQTPKMIAAHAQGLDQLFKRGIAGALADAVYRALHLARTGRDRSQAVGHGHAEIVMAMRTENDRVGAAYIGIQPGKALGDLD